MENGDKVKILASQNITDRLLVWNIASRDQGCITKDLADGNDVSEVYGLGKAGLFDEFFYFLEKHGVNNLFKGLDPKLKKRASNVNFNAVLLIYIMRIVSGVPFFWQIESVLLKSQSLMRIVGFNALSIREGTSQRGVGKSDKRKGIYSAPPVFCPLAALLRCSNPHI